MKKYRSQLLDERLKKFNMFLESDSEKSGNYYWSFWWICKLDPFIENGMWRFAQRFPNLNSVEEFIRELEQNGDLYLRGFVEKTLERKS